MPSIRTCNNRARRARERALYAPRFTLVDPRPIREANPHSFHLPCDDRLAAIAAGDHVKLIFEPDGGGIAERMWVMVGSARPGDDQLGGILVNQPFDPRALGIVFGFPVTFRRTDVIDIDTVREDDPAETNTQDDQVFARCTMDERVYKGELPAVRIVRDAAEPEGFPFHAGDATFGWGGWRIEGEGLEPGMPTEVGTPVIALRHPDGVDFSALLGEPEGSAFTLVDREWRKD